MAKLSISKIFKELNNFKVCKNLECNRINCKKNEVCHTCKGNEFDYSKRLVEYKLLEVLEDISLANVTDFDAYEHPLTVSEDKQEKCCKDIEEE